MFEFSHSLGDVIKRARLEQGLTQINLAGRIAIDSRTILNIDNYNGNPKMEVLFPLIRTLKIDPWPIFYPELDGQNASFRQMQLLLKECSEEEMEALLPICKAALSVLRSKNVIEIK